jgi:hypothetical protein
MSLTKIIQRFRERFSEHEPWKIAHEEALKILLFEERVGELAVALDAILKLDAQLQSKALEEEAGSPIAREYREWTKTIRTLIRGAYRGFQKTLASSVAKRYREYKDRKYSDEDLQNLLHRLEWCDNPHEHLDRVLRPPGEVARDLSEGRCERFPTEGE